MFSNEIRERLLQLDHNKIIVMESGGTIALDERKAGGEAMLHVEGINPYVAFCHVDDGRWPYLKHRTCADHFILEYKDKVWYLHVLEFKRTVTTGGWEHIKEQFKGGIFNAETAAGFLGIHIDCANITVYTCHRVDRIRRPVDPVELRAEMSGVCGYITQDWEKKLARLNLYGQRDFLHERVLLNISDGTGSLQLA